MRKTRLAELSGVLNTLEPKFRANLSTAVELCRIIEAGAARYGCHIALTGGCLYKDGDRKDFDLMFYRIRQVESIDQDGLFQYLERLGFSKPKGFGWIFKSEYKGVQVDIFFPEEQGGEYVAVLSGDLPLEALGPSAAQGVAMPICLEAPADDFYDDIP